MARGMQLIRTDDAVAGTVTFYDRRQTNAILGRIARIDANAMLEAAGLAREDVPANIIKAAIHGWTQNVLDSSNKLEGDERVAYIRKACGIIQNGGWATAPVDEAEARARAIKALVAIGFTEDAAIAAVDKKA